MPQRVKEELSDIKYNDLIIYQDSEKLYFRLAQKYLETKTEVIRLDKRSFCVLGSPPWVTWQSYLIFLEKSFDDALKTKGSNVFLNLMFRIVYKSPAKSSNRRKIKTPHR